MLKFARWAWGLRDGPSCGHHGVVVYDGKRVTVRDYSFHKRWIKVNMVEEVCKSDGCCHICFEEGGERNSFPLFSFVYLTSRTLS